MENKLKMESKDMTQYNIDKIAELFPQVVTEVADPTGTMNPDGTPKLKKAVDFEKLKLVLSAGSGDYVVADDEHERYEFTWVGKRQAMIDAATPIRKTLRPYPNESKNWDTTENLYIEGDNLEVLKLLQESYLGKVKMIYIDPPYNTGKDFVYKDNFTQGADEYNEELGMFDEEENRLFQNTETNGRFHSDWCSMIYPRLQLARNLLTDDGVIFISIDDNEVENLKKICDEVFGAGNFVAQMVWERAFAPKNDAKFISNSHDYVVMFAKSITNFRIGRLDRTEEANSRYTNPDNDPRGVWMSSDISVKTYSASCDYPITTPSGKVVEPPAGRCWRLAKNEFFARLQDNRIWFGSDGNGVPRIKRFLNELKFDGMAPTSILFHKDVGHSQEGSQEVIKLFEDNGVFDGPKPIRLLERLLTLANLQNDSIILDFFSGSSSTAHAVMKMNAEKERKNKFIMVQLPEQVNDAKKNADYATICEIGKERIRRAGAKIEEEQKVKNNGLFADEAKPLDTGFRVFKVDTTNMKEVYYAAGAITQKDLFDMEDNIKGERKDIDLLYGALLDWGIELSYPHTTEKIEGCNVHTVNAPLTDEIDLIACFDKEVSEAVIRTIAIRKPMRALFRDHSFTNSANKINVFEIFKAISPDTTVKVI